MSMIVACCAGARASWRRIPPESRSDRSASLRSLRACRGRLQPGTAHARHSHLPAAALYGACRSDSSGSLLVLRLR